MTRYLLQRATEGKADTPLTWTCMECEQAVENIDRHTHEHGSTHLDVFESQAVLRSRGAPSGKA